MVGLLELFKLYLGIDPLDLTRDAELTAYLERAIELIDDYLDRELLEATHTDKIEGPKDFIKVRNHPIKTGTVTRIEIDGNTEDLAEYRIYDKEGLVKKISGTCLVSFTGCWVEIDYTGGYDPLPGWAQEAIVQTALAFLTFTEAGGQSTTTAGGVKKESIPGIYTVEFDSSSSSDTGASSDFAINNIPSSVQMLLEKHKDKVMM